jgi:DNA-binding MarR family transcriptional regulator
MNKQPENIDIILEHITSLLTTKYDQLLIDQLGIGYSQYKLLIQFESDEIIKQNTMATSLGQTEASISRQVKILNLKGLITRSFDPKNRKTKVVLLTKLGHTIKEAARDFILNQNRDFLSVLESKDKLKLSSNLEKLHLKLCSNNKHNQLL